MAVSPPESHSAPLPSPAKTNGAVSALALVLLWTLIGLVFATAGGGVQRALTTWYLWGALAWVLVFVDRRLPVARERLAVRLACHVPLSLLFATLYVCLILVVNHALHGTLPTAEEWRDIPMIIRTGGIQWNLLNYWLILGTYLAYDYHREVQERRRRTVHLESLLTEARLSALRAQLNPHFLFNALNTVSAYVESDPKRARAMLGHLGDLLRFSLDSGERREIRLAEEIDALEHYLAIQSARFAERLRTRVEIPPKLRDARVPGLVLQPLVENAITHGLCDLPGVGEIRVTAREEGKDLLLSVSDNGIGLPSHWSLDHDAGIGLSNTRNRLAETYGASHRFSVAPAPEGGVVAEIRIPCRIAASDDQEEHRAKVARSDRRR